jgi:hypothetical protein
MKLLRKILFVFLISMAATAVAADKDVQVDLLMAKITASLKANKATDALPYFAELESMEPTLAKPLPQSFHYYYIDALSKSGNNDKALSRAEIYLNKFGKKGKYYDKVIESMAPIQMEMDKQREKDNVYSAAMAVYERDMKLYKEKYEPYILAKNKCDYQDSYEGRLAGCENWVAGMNGGSEETRRDLIKKCSQRHSDCTVHVPTQPVEPRKPNHE